MPSIQRDIEIQSDTPIQLRILDVLCALLVLSALWLVLAKTPIEATMGAVQKVFYFHVAAAWVGMLSMLIAGVAGAIYLRKRQSGWDLAGEAAIELGLVLSIIAIASGSIWARPIWNTWWTWDPRLITATIMVLIYLAYFFLRQNIENPGQRARFSAVYAIMGSISVPLTFLSIRYYRTIHPVIITGSESASAGNFAMTDSMRLAFFFALFTFTILGLDLFWHRLRLGMLREAVAEKLDTILLDQ